MSNRINNIKSDFPIFNQSNLVYLDSAATTQKPYSVLKATESLYIEANANVHRAIYSIGIEATNRFEKAREKSFSSHYLMGVEYLYGVPLQLTPLQHIATHYLKKLEKNPPPPTTCWGSSILMGFP